MINKILIKVKIDYNMKNIFYIPLIILALSSCQIQINADHIKEGNKYLAIGNITEAMGEFNYALFLDSSKIEAYRGLTQCYLRMGDFDNALRCSDKYIVENPKAPEGYNDRGSVYLYLGKYEKAITDFDSLIALDTTRNVTIGLFNKSEALKELNRYEESIKCLDSLLVIDSADSRSIYKRGLLKKTIGNEQEACLDLKLAADMGESEALQEYETNCE